MQRHEGFGRLERLKRRTDFLAVQKTGRRHVAANYFLFVLPRKDSARAGDPVRLGITVSKKVGGAVVRNRVKRWVREAYRRRGRAVAGRPQANADLGTLAGFPTSRGWEHAGQSPSVPTRIDLVVVARPSAATLGYAGTVAELYALLGKSGLGAPKAAG